MHEPSPLTSQLAAKDQFLALSSTRSRLARKEGITFEALGGGAGGVLDLNKLRIVYARASADTSGAHAGGASDPAADPIVRLDTADALSKRQEHNKVSPFVRHLNLLKSVREVHHAQLTFRHDCPNST